jgi:hypothetical protein
MSPWLPMKTAPRDGTVILLCELNYSSGEGYVMPGCWMRANGDPKMESFWAVSPTSHVPVHLIRQYENREGMAVRWRKIAMTPECWMPLPPPETTRSIHQRMARRHRKESKP